MFKVREKFQCRNVWIRVSEIVKVYKVENGDYTAIMFRNGDYLCVTESVEEILAAIDGRECEPFSLHGYVSD